MRIADDYRRRSSNFSDLSDDPNHVAAVAEIASAEVRNGRRRSSMYSVNSMDPSSRSRSLSDGDVSSLSSFGRFRGGAVEPPETLEELLKTLELPQLRPRLASKGIGSVRDLAAFNAEDLMGLGIATNTVCETLVSAANAKLAALIESAVVEKAGLPSTSNSDEET
eukprot:Opistho-1_new@91704